MFPAPAHYRRRRAIQLRSLPATLPAEFGHLTHRWPEWALARPEVRNLPGRRGTETACHKGVDMLSDTADHRAAELRRLLERGALRDLPHIKVDGVLTDAELAVRLILANLDHLRQDETAGPPRWGVLEQHINEAYQAITSATVLGSTRRRAMLATPPSTKPEKTPAKAETTRARRGASQMSVVSTKNAGASR